jgi:flagellar biosynthesis component FlhA
MFRLIVVLFCVMYVVCVLCLIVVPLPPSENPFAVQINIYLSTEINQRVQKLKWGDAQKLS